MVVDNTVGNVYNFSTFIFTVIIALQEYGDEIFGIIKNRIYVILPLIALGFTFIYATKKIYINNIILFNKIKSFIILILSIISFFLCFLMINHLILNWHNNLLFHVDNAEFPVLTNHNDIHPLIKFMNGPIATGRNVAHIVEHIHHLLLLLSASSRILRHHLLQHRCHNNNTRQLLPSHPHGLSQPPSETS